MSSGLVTLEPADPRGSVARALLEALTREIEAIYADRGFDGNAGFSVTDLDAPRSVFVVASSNGEPVGCGALRPLDAQTGEVKRMFTVPAWRGRGVAAAVLADLEQRARQFGYRTMRLETGDRQVGAIRLYERCGYRQIRPFGVYVQWDDSVCFEKTLGAEEGGGVGT